ncbi:MAG: glycoside hydrolase family 2, partial [Calditrichaeota bacterium]
MAKYRLLLSIFIFSSFLYAQPCPLPEHPRPDFERERWVNLNGFWSFEFDAENRGIAEQWQIGEKSFSRQINVPFPWGSPLSGVSDETVIGWYQRKVQIPEKWRGERVFLIIGAADWQTTGWLGEQEIGSFQGGYTPFEFEITDAIQWGEEQRI